MSTENQIVRVPERVLRTALLYLYYHVDDQLKGRLDSYPIMNVFWIPVRKLFMSNYSLGREQALHTLTRKFNNRAIDEGLIKKANEFLHSMNGVKPPGYWQDGFKWRNEDLATRFEDMSLEAWDALSEEDKDERFKQVLDGYLRFVVFNDVNSLKILMKVMKVQHPIRGEIDAFDKTPSDEIFAELRKNLWEELSGHLKGLTRGRVEHYIEVEQRRLDAE